MNPFPFDPAVLAPLDWVGLGLVLVLVLLGLWRGLWWQVIRLAGIVASVAVARTLAPDFAAWILDQWPEITARLASGAAWFVIFFAVLLVATLLGLLGQRLLEAMHLGLANRLGGAALGAATGLVLHVAVLVLVCQLAPEPFVGRVVAGTYSERLVQTVGERWEVVVDGSAAAEIQRLLDRGAEGDASAAGPDAAPRNPRPRPQKKRFRRAAPAGER